MNVSVIIPAYNEEDGILATLAEAKAVLTAAPMVEEWEIVVVNDGSHDRTQAVLADAEDVRVINHPHNAGYGRSLKTGILAAAHDTIIITDADLTYPFEVLPELLALYEQGFDMVVGARTGNEYKESALKAPLRSILRWLVEFTSGRTIPDINSGLRVFSKNTSISYFAHLCDTFSFTTSMTLSYMMTSRFVAYLTIPYRERKGKTKIRLFRDSLRTMQYIVQATVYYNPLKIFMLLSALCAAGAVTGLIGSTIFGLLSGYVLGLAGIALSIFMLAFGLLAVLLKQIMDK